MAGNKAMKRAVKTNDAVRLLGNIPLIVDKTELITPEMAQDLLKHNKSNRPINWRKVQEYAEIMKQNQWELTAQGIVLDETGNILTGQKRLWAVIYSNTSVLMRISRGSKKSTANLLDRGTPQSARDLASRKTEVRHSPTEASISRGICAIRGNLKPSVDELSRVIAEKNEINKVILRETSRSKKTKSVLMIMSVISSLSGDIETAKRFSLRIPFYAGKLEKALEPETAERCWNKGAAFTLALEQARKILEHE